MSNGIRFAPSPTGRFHIGNLRTAWIAQWWARTLNQPFVIRSEDIDHARNLPGAHERQLADLRELGIIADQIIIQSERRARHWELFLRARAEGAVYPCTCSRKDVQAALAGLASAPHSDDIIYSGACRNTPTAAASSGGVAWRFRNTEASGARDFIVARTNLIAADEPSFVPAYHWACAIDDAEGEYALLVRAWDLASAASTQRVIQAWMSSPAFRAPAIFHTSLVTQADGHRLEKRTRNVTLSEILSRGFSIQQVNELLSRSFQATRQEFAEGKIWGELKKEQSLDEIGFVGLA